MRYLLYGHGGAYNHGAEAILKTTLQGIKSIDAAPYVCLSSHFPKQDQEFSIVPDCFLERDMGYVDREKRESARGITAGSYDKEIYRSTLDAIDRQTIALSVGGDNYCYPAWHRWQCIHKEIKQRGAKDILWSCSINPECITQEMLETLSTHDLITARESITCEELKRRGLQNVVQCADVAFLLCPEKTVLPKQFLINQTVAINISPLVMRREKKEGIVKESVYRLMDMILQKTGLQIALIPHVVMPMDNDYEVLREIYEYYAARGYSDRICLCSDRLSAAEYKYIISNCRFGVFARTHASIAAYSTGVPALVLGYSVKAKGIAKDMEMSPYVLDISNLESSSQLSQGLLLLMQKEKEVKKVLQEKTKRMQTLAEDMFNKIYG